MAHIKNRLRGLLVAFVALVAALAIVPGVAQAASEDVEWQNGTETQTITITGLKGDATINIYEIGKVSLDTTTNETTFTVTAVTNDEGVKVGNYVKLDAPTATQTKEMLDSITAYGAHVVTDASYTHAEGEGTYTSTPLSAGLYYVEITDEAGDYTYQAMVAPVNPVSKDNGASWVLVDPNITAKVSDSSVKKDRVSDTPVNFGDEVKFTVTVTLNQYMSSYKVYDQMTGLEYVTGTMNVFLGNTAEGDPDFTGDDPTNGYYDVAFDAGTHLMTVTFNKEYLETLSESTTVTLEYTAKVCTHATTAGLSNKAYTDNNPVGDQELFTLGKAGVYKYEKDKNNKPLAGAIFRVFESDGVTPVKTTANEDVYVKTGSDGFAWTNEDSCNAEGNALTGEVILEEGFEVVFVETKAPAGYRLPSEDTNKFQATTVAMGETAAAQTAQIPNTPAGGEHGVDLPETGGMGTVALTAAGVVLVAGAAAFIVRSRKEN